jgi:hypothetical protein
MGEVPKLGGHWPQHQGVGYRIGVLLPDASDGHRSNASQCRTGERSEG